MCDCAIDCSFAVGGLQIIGPPMFNDSPNHHILNRPIEGLFHPARRKHTAHACDAAGAAAKQVFEAGSRLLEQTLMLE